MDFNNIKIEQLVKYINLELKKNKKLSVNKICDLIGIKKSTLKSRMARGGYSYNVDKREYKIADKVTPVETTEQATEEVKNIVAIDNVVEEIKPLTEPFKGIVDTDKLNILLDNLDSVLELINKNKSNKLTSNVEVEKSFRSGRNNVSSLRIDEGLYKEIKTRARVKEITITDIVNKALEEYLNRMD